MAVSTIDVAFTPSVKAVQERRGLAPRLRTARRKRRLEQHRHARDLAAFIAQRDSLFFATASAAGQPYVQHRGGPRGFLRILDERTLGFADFRGNRQYITVGNLAENERAFMFLIDYEKQQRIKLWGRARVVENDTALLDKLMPEGYRARPEQAILFTLEAWDANCPQHIPRLYAEEDVARIVGELEARIAALEAQVADA